MKKRIFSKLCSLISALAVGFICVSSLNMVETDATTISRRYKRYDFITGIVTEYTLSVSSNFNNNVNTVATLSTNDEYTPCYDTRIVDCAGTGFIVGKHAIATNAHCVFNYNTHNFNGQTVFQTFTYPNGVPTKHALTIISMHIPVFYDDEQPGDDRFNYDYALVEVAEDLSSYGYFNLGVALEGIATGENNGQEVSALGLPQGAKEGREKPHLSEGRITAINEYKIKNSCPISYGSSGSPLYTSTTYDGMNYETVIGIQSTLVTETTADAVRMTLPVIAFLRQFDNEPYLS